MDFGGEIFLNTFFVSGDTSFSNNIPNITKKPVAQW
jgi:hypothetical protein